MTVDQIKNTLEAALLAAGAPVSVNRMMELFAGNAEKPSREEVRGALKSLIDDYDGRGIELVEVASGFRVQVRQDQEPWVARLWDEKPPRYSRALLETLALIAYRQPITRAEIEDVRGVSVSTNIIRTLQEREWVRVVGHREVPGKPAMYGTTREFLDYFNLKRLDDLPELSEIRDLDKIHPELALEKEEQITDSSEEQEVGDSTEVEGEELAVDDEANDTSEDSTTIH